ncbi:AraC family transcriptional regulator [Nitrogeniibacter mangrovi]|uniref:AraC family transcriptional regulator n=1 Tax=Nitrogeniibacter mangrovi TaxID=2016596 RepID=A0A6C1BAP7_9RHOO|nr:AraC family transcriptional regulator [Nitrogeniibacter mangrovi]QID19344.1 AraC family transcriptional regulator [Nitrogeniibacter mangrovi]
MAPPQLIRRMTRVIEFLYAHLDDDLSLDRVAEVAHVSTCHFHRLYRALTGETLAETVRRLRFHRSARELLDADRPLGQVARRAGYGSPEAFSRAFKRHFGIPPGAYRALRQSWAAPTLHLNPEPFDMDDIRIDTLPALDLVGIRHRGDYMGIGQAFDRLCLWAGPKGMLGPHVRLLGAYWDDPAVVARSDLRSAACLGAPTDAAEGEVMPLRMAAGPYACLIHVGPYAELEAAYQRVFAWIAREGHELAEAPCFEEYLNDPASTPPLALRTRIMVPLLG